jgi:hypothetical protein
MPKQLGLAWSKPEGYSRWNPQAGLDLGPSDLH